MKKLFLVVLCLFLAGCGTTAVMEPEPELTVCPLDFEGEALLSGSELYYCKDNALWSMNWADGSSRMLRAFSGGIPRPISCTGKTVQVCVAQRFLLIDAANGAILSNSTEPIFTGFSCQRYGNIDCLLVQETMLPLPAGFRMVGFLEERNQAVIAGKGVLQLYDLATGSCLAEVDCPGSRPSQAASSEDGTILLLDTEKNQLLRWNTSESRVPNCVLPVTPLYTPEAPDMDGLRQCRETAREIGKQYGFQFKIWMDAVQAGPWDYQLTPEYLVPVIEEALVTIQNALARFPEGFLKNLSGDAQEVSICLVRQIQGLTDTPALETASGLQFWQGENSFLVFCPGPDLERAVYHELCHMIDSRILETTKAYDDWDARNPSGFSYGEDAADPNAFVDAYAMTSPFEDRARILECAMMEDMDSLFQSPSLQKKLQTICAAIRQAFWLDDSTPLPWEQYLNT